MELRERQKTILEALVREYVRTAKPVSSGDIMSRGNVRFSSATIRNDFQVLADQGYVVQPHVSAGRVPTDKGYRFYINRMERAKPGRRTKGAQAISELSVEQYASDEEFLRSAAVILSELSHGFTTAGLVDDGLFFKYGFSEVLREPEFSDQESVRDFAACIDSFEKSVEGIFSNIPAHHPEVFIGSENPIHGAREYGMVVYAYEKDGHTGKRRQIVSILGPKRMDYKHNVELLDAFGDAAREFYTE